MAMEDPVPMVTQVRTPEALVGGVYANGLATWATPTEFTLDFLVNLPPEHAQDGAGNPLVVAPQLVVARVKIPPSLAHHAMRSLGQLMDEHESNIGKIPDFLGITTLPPPESLQEDDQ